ncbi:MULTISPECIES: glycerophosphodiester phosphodiesterase family protein [unclassified Legionella]|uniref:glycerophosphodiester phosphodiesterase n=1 Tax=unclassified Legionella TaxID=2622702 RepID=UPI0010543AF7|nr:MULTISPECIES: glycerophosphodiester phosphodiesterase family protein [unclassified Legionella]MDI9818029.1 glycerophosphodiester phosphodiesterase family protein [Legionella sp. PL877]
MGILDCVQKLIDYYFAFIPRKKPDSLALSEAKFIAHRGAHDNNHTIIENTLAAFDRALKLGCWGIEFDIQETSDHILVVNHDPTLTRLWGKKFAVKDLDFQSLRKMLPQIPSLDEVIQRYGKKMHLFIELKAPFNAEAILEKSLHGLTSGKDYHLLSLDEAIFASFSHFPRKCMLLVAGPNNAKKFCRLSLQKHYGGVLGHYLLITDKLIKQLQSTANQIVGVGFIDSKFSLYRELNRGLRWLFSNNVASLSHHLGQPREENAQN